MTFRALLLTKALAGLVFGLFLLAAPSVLFGVLGGNLNASGLFAAREYGAAMIGILFLTYLARNISATDARCAILVDLLVYDAIGVAITVVAILSHVLNALGWGIVLVYLLFAVWSGIILMGEGSKGLHQQEQEA